MKRILTGEEYIAKRAGEISEETSYVLKKFQVEAPPLLTNVNLQVKDMDIHRVQGVPGNLSIKEVWKMMKEANMKSMPITRDEHLEGMITIVILQHRIWMCMIAESWRMPVRSTAILIIHWTEK